MTPRQLEALASADYVDELYQRWSRDPDSVDPEWASYFSGVASDGAGSPTARVYDESSGEARVLGIFGLVNSYRENGHLIAALDPLGHNPTSHPLLDLGEYGFTQADLDLTLHGGNFRGLPSAKLRDLLEALRQTYCGTLGIEYADLAEKEQRDWLQERMEPRRNRPDLTPEDRVRVLSRLIQAEDFERFLQAKFPTQKRFSLEGGESLIPLLDVIVEESANLGSREVVMGMAHRGRLNVLVNVLGKPLEMVLAEFEGALLPKDVMGDGDVKYHLGFSRDYKTRGGLPVHLSLAPNPSHLEMVNPVIEGMVRAKQMHAGDTTCSRVISLLIHGDAAFSGEGIVPETLALSGLAGYATGGTIHIIHNNQVGFTTSPDKARSTPYASDVAKMIRAPVIHVNGDDPEAAAHAARIAVAFRQTFKKDVIIDLICYRRHGHNELDDPSFTQPVMYVEIAKHPTVRRLYEDKLIAEKVVSEGEAKRIAADWREVLDAGLDYSRDFMPRQQVFAFGGLWKGLGWAGDDWGARTAVDEATLRRIAEAFVRIPEGFAQHARLGKLMEQRLDMMEGEGTLDWGTAEALAVGSLLLEKTPVRLSGQDSGRGTFSHRHAVWRDVENGQPYVPLNHLADDQALFEVVDSPLSEAAVMGFEYGMSCADPRRLVMWEAQFGDFANVAQVLIDQFIASAESKWQRMSGLTLLLPHGYEGQGPEHSSARLERFLQLCAENNLQVCNLTTPGQYFHALRRQIHRGFRKPLVLMTPKSLLRHKLAVSPLRELTEGTFQPAIDETETIDRAAARRLVLCSGKVYYTLLQGRRQRDPDNIALVRVEQLYPFPAKELAAILERYPEAQDIRWVQEEPANMGAWSFLRHRLEALLRGGQTLGYVGPDEAASPAPGNYKVHAREEAELVDGALERVDRPQRGRRPKVEALGGRS